MQNWILGNELSSMTNTSYTCKGLVGDFEQVSNQCNESPNARPALWISQKVSGHWSPRGEDCLYPDYLLSMVIQLQGFRRPDGREGKMSCPKALKHFLRILLCTFFPMSHPEQK